MGSSSILVRIQRRDPGLELTQVLAECKTLEALGPQPEPPGLNWPEPKAPKPEKLWAEDPKKLLNPTPENSEPSP